MVEILTIDELNALTRGKHAVSDKLHDSADLLPLQHLWGQLLGTVHAPSVSDKHMTAACNAICFTARALAHNPNKEISSFVLSPDIWTQIFGSARAAFAVSKNKPALQVLDTLAYLAEANPDKQEVSKSVSTTVADMVKIIFNQNPKKCLKEASTVLYFFLRRLPELIPFSEIILEVFRASEPLFRQHCLAASIDLQELDTISLQHWNAFITALLMAMNITESKSATLKLLALLPDLRNLPSGLDMVGMIDQALRIYGASNESALEDVSKDILPSIITTPTQYQAFLVRQYSGSQFSEARVLIILTLLQFGVKRSFINATDLPEIIHRTVPSPNGDEDKATSATSINNLLTNNSPAIRLKTCDLITFSTSPKTPTLPIHLACITQSLPYLHNDTDAFQRGELLSIFRRFLTRLVHSRHALSHRPEAEQDIQAVDSFLQSYMLFLVTELSPHLSYGRHILALDLILYVIDIVVDTIKADQIFCSPTVRKLGRQLYRLVLDPYDDVRTFASQAISRLRLRSTEKNNFASALEALATDEQILTKAIRHAAATNRADHADAIGRLLDLMHSQDMEPEKELGQMVKKLSVFINQFVNTLEDFDTSTQYPLHAHVLGIRYIIQRRGRDIPDPATGMLGESLLGVCWGIWILSQPHLCVDSPEMENEALDEADSAGPKDQLAYAWRALRDSNLLMQAMLDNFPKRLELIKSIGQLCFDQLGSLRHRGAFSTVAQTFLLSCQCARASNDSRIVALLNDWFRQAVTQLEAQADKLTRRSAGLPAMFIALLNPHDRNEFMLSFEKLVQIATKDQVEGANEGSNHRLRLPQVHGLNCLKDIITSSRFRTITEPLVVPLLNIAAKSMTSPIWAIKNCGLMLLRASINRLDTDTSLGASEAALNLKSTTHDHRRPFDVAILLLQPNASETEGQTESSVTDGSIGQEGEFAGLDLLSRLYIRNHERALARRLVSQRLGHPLWHIRTQASRVLAGMNARNTRCEEFIQTAKHLKCLQRPNEVHGHLLYLRELLSSLQIDLNWPQYVAEAGEPLMELELLPMIRNIEINKAAWLEVVSRFLFSPTNALNKQIMKNTLSDTPDDEGKNVSVCALLDRALATVTLQNIPTNGADGQRHLSQLFSKDEDVACYTMESFRTHELRMSEPSIANAVYDFLLKSTASNARAATVDAYVRIASNCASAPRPDITRLSAIINFSHIPTRTYFRSQLVLYAHLCENAWSHGVSMQGLSSLKQLAPGFILHLRTAANEEVEDTTRLAALDALGHLAKAQDPVVKLSEHFGFEGTFEIFSVLYDLLNDDDDDHRAQACRILSKLLKGKDSVLDIHCATDSRAQIITFLQSRAREHNDEVLENECVRRLAGMRMEIPREQIKTGLINFLAKNTVKQQVDTLLQIANDLFAEEKQNLYIDDISETRAWSMIASEFGASSWREHFTPWLDEGLQALMQVFAVPSRKTKLEFSLDFEVLIIRVVSIARALGLFADRVIELQIKCSQAHLGESVIAAFA